MKPNFARCLALGIVLLPLLAMFAPSNAFAITLEQIVSREHPSFTIASSRLNIGRDGMVYLSSRGDNSYVLRMGRDGKNKMGMMVDFAATYATANAKGQIAVSNAHFNHSVTIYDANLKKGDTQSDFLVSDATGFDAPAWVTSGESGDFFAVDQHRDRILRISPQGKVLRAIAIPRSPEGNGGRMQQIRVNEKKELLYVLTMQGPLRAVGFDGLVKWSQQIPVRSDDGGFDVDADGSVYALGFRDDTIKKFDSTGQPAGTIKLDMGALKPQGTNEGIRGLQVFGNEVLVKRNHPTELFQRYSLDSGKLLGVVQADYDRLSVTYDKELWTAGETMPFSVNFVSPNAPAKQQWHAWLRPLGETQYLELPIQGGKITVPAGAAGIHQVKVTPETTPLESGLLPEYAARGWVEIRRPESKGTINVFSPQNRVYYAAGDTIPLSILVRTAGSKNIPLTLQLRENSAKGLVLAQTTATADASGVLSLSIPATLTSALQSGNYAVTATAPGFTPVGQALIIGSGDSGTSFHLIRHGDYGETYPRWFEWQTGDVVPAYLNRQRKLGFNFFVDRLGSPVQRPAFEWSGSSEVRMGELARRLAADAAGVAPEKIQTGTVLHQVMAAYSAYGMNETAILLMMDTGLPLGDPGFDNRTPEKLQQDIGTVTKALLPYRSFRGWSWHANWWIYKKRGAAAARTPQEKNTYEAAFKRAKETGAWDPVLDSVADFRFSFAVDAQELFKKAMLAAAPEGRLLTAGAGTYRNVEAYPPTSFKNVDEVDLQGQFEQIFMPYFPSHAVDFYSRPGKPAWAHPELWNDAGTGEQIMPMLFSMAMRGADGVGTSDNVPAWSGPNRKIVWRDDPRISHFGSSSIYRATNSVLKRYGSWLRTLENGDDVAIAISSRPFKIDEWMNVTGRHFARVAEAYAACLHAHHPATFVFAEDLKPDSFRKYKAVLVVGQYMEMEPALAAALKNAQTAGVKVFADGTCRAEVVKSFTPLGVSFDKFEKDKAPGGDDAAYMRYPQYVSTDLPAVRQALDAAISPVAAIDNPEIWASQRVSGKGRYLFVVNNTSSPLGPGLLWRTTTLQASRRPVTASVTLKAPTAAVYDVFALKKITPQNNVVEANLRSLPARLYALLPAEIAGVALRGPAGATSGSAFKWWAQVRDSAGRGIESSIPIRLRLLAANGEPVSEQFLAAPSAGASGQVTVPLDTPAGQLTLEVTELISGQGARLPLPVKAAAVPVAFSAPFAQTAATVSGTAAQSLATPSVNEFGPHLRDVAVLAGGTVAVFNASNWDGNLYGIDCDTGKTLWRKRVGDYFAFAPLSLGNGFGVQGFDYGTPEGYHLYIGDEKGELQRRFALYGLPRRLPLRFVPGIINDRDNPINNFAVPEGGAWVASAGDLGLAVWAKDGKLLWKNDWWKTRRRTGRLDAPDKNTLIVAETVEGIKAAGYNATDGKALWSLNLAPTGTVLRIVHSADGKTLALLTDYEGGHIFLLRGGKLVNSLRSSALDLALSPDGERMAVIRENQLKMYGVTDGLHWIFSGDDILRAPRFSPDGNRLAMGSEIGTLYVVDENGKSVYEQDNAAITVPAWLPNGDLLAGNWMGKITRLDAAYHPRWQALAQSGVDEVAPAPPTQRIADWGNAESTPLPLTPNLLTETQAVIRYISDVAPQPQLAQPYASLADGKLDPPAEPWLDWIEVNLVSPASIVFDPFRSQLRLDAITFYEDPAHPESWLRDGELEYWDATTERWVFVQNLLSDSAVHTHKLARPVEAGKFRIRLPLGLYGNLRWREVVFHGQVLGASHPDIIAKKPLAVLFDDSDEFKNVFQYTWLWRFRLDGAYSGGRYLQANADQTISPAYFPNFGHSIPTWDFPITENTKPGEYRWLQFAVKAMSPDVKGATLRLGGARFHLGVPSGEAHLAAVKVGDAVPQQWQTVRVDLWKINGKPFSIQNMYLSAVGGPVGFDQIVLGRTENDLPPMSK